MKVLIADLLKLSKIGNATTTFTNVEMNDVLKFVLESMNEEVTRSGAMITVDRLPTVCGDSIQLIQVFKNLVGNAIKYRSSYPPKIHISCEAQDRFWLFTVQDNGIGIDSSDSTRIFEVFQRLHTMGEYPGTGIGLAVCKKILDRHRGEIWVRSTLGEGAAFRFTLPMSALASPPFRSGFTPLH